MRFKGTIVLPAARQGDVPMLEPLVSSRIRRTLLEYLLCHPTDRFYLRGLAKELGLSVSPLRRELKRQEQSGLLRATHEGNILFYQVNISSPLYVRLQQVMVQAPSVVSQLVEPGWEQPVLPPEQPARGTTPPTTVSQPIPVGIVTMNRRPSLWTALRHPLGGPALIGVAAIGLALMLIAAGVFSVALTNRELARQAVRSHAGENSAVTLVVPPAAGSGVMHGSRWRIVPGGFGGFTTADREKSY